MPKRSNAFPLGCQKKRKEKKISTILTSNHYEIMSEVENKPSNTTDTTSSNESTTRMPSSSDRHILHDHDYVIIESDNEGTTSTHQDSSTQVENQSSNTTDTTSSNESTTRMPSSSERHILHDHDYVIIESHNDITTSTHHDSSTQVENKSSTTTDKTISNAPSINRTRSSEAQILHDHDYAILECTPSTHDNDSSSRNENENSITTFSEASSATSSVETNSREENIVEHGNAVLHIDDQLESTANNIPSAPGIVLDSPYPARRYSPGLDIFFISQMNYRCPHCCALRFKGENMNCCHNGKVILEKLSPYPQELKELLQNDTANSKHFLKNIRNYNSSFAFASMGALMAPPPGRGPYCFRIHGQLYHRSGTLHPKQGDKPKYGQVYILEGQQAIQTRLDNAQGTECRPHIIQTIQNVLDTTSPYAAAYKNMLQVEKEEMRKAAISGDTPPSVSMMFKRGADQRRYNLPTCDEVAAVFVGEDGMPPDKRDVAVYPRNKPLQLINCISSNADPMIYPLIFPRGDLGWVPDVRHQGPNATKKRNKITMLQYYSHRLAIRDGFSALHRSGKLFQQYIVDAYVKTEANRLNFIRRNQSKLRVERYKGLMDHIHNQSTARDVPVGRVVIHPSSFQGSPRNMQQHYQDAMAIVSKYGKPDLFLTMTCNTKWKEIQENLIPGQQPSDRPDLIARVFNLKLKELLNDITKKHVLGRPVAWVYVIEYQKRGLPHSHMLIILNEDSKLRTPQDIDTLISATIPDPITDPELADIIKSTMIHGPCGNLNPSSVCMEDGVCGKDYPKQFQEQTFITDNGYPQYKRPDNGRTITVKDKDIDNRWVVPHSPYLTKKFKAHINLEACMSIKSVKYLFKYVYKGHDCANLQATESTHYHHDEVTSFLDARYVSAPEAMWRLSEYKMHAQSHTVHRLPVHLEEQQNVYFTHGNEEAALERSESHNTQLTGWFHLNETEPEANQYLYTEVPQHYVWDTSTKTWKKRKQKSKSVDRMYSVSPTDQERFYLRLLLLHVPGAKSYTDLKTVDEIEVPTFKEACKQRGLLEDDTTWHETLSEAAKFKMPSQLRFMFATILANNIPSDPLSLWNKHKYSMTEDLSRNFAHQYAEQIALQHIESILQNYGLNCSGFQLPLDKNLAEIPTESSPNNLDDANLTLNEEQQGIVDAIMESHENGKEHPIPSVFFMDGPGGTGKTTVYNRLITCFHAMNLKVSATAFTGIAATLLHQGQTLHSFYKLPVPITDGCTCNVPYNSKQANIIKETSLFIIDEVSMVPKHALNAIDTCFRDIMQLDIPFGGKIFLLGGDFRQVLPVIPRAKPATLIENTIKQSKVFQDVNIFKLTKNMRAEIDQREFAKWVLEVGDDKHQQASNLPPNSIILPKEIITNNVVDAMCGNNVAPDEQEAILTPKNDATFHINYQILQRLPGRAKIYYSVDSIKCNDPAEEHNFPSEFINSLTPSGMPQHKLQLKEGAMIMLMRNLDIRQGLCNGTRLIVCHVHKNVIDARIIRNNKRVLIPRVRLSPSDTKLPFQLQRTQFPVRLAFCMTINKAQGQTFNKVGVYLPQPVFTHGQLYVALSRARSLRSIFVQVDNTHLQGANQGVTHTQNVVFRAVLND